MRERVHQYLEKGEKGYFQSGSIALICPYFREHPRFLWHSVNNGVKIENPTSGTWLNRVIMKVVGWK